MIDTVIDLYHRSQPDFEALAKAGITAVIHKATEGATVQDPEYIPRKRIAKDLGLLWGSYHFVSGISVTDQLDNYLSHVKPENDEVVCIDYERSTSGPDMTLEQLERLVVLLKQQIGRSPLIYGGDLLRHALQLRSSPILAECPLWYARYANQPIGIPPATWSTFTLWQYTNGAVGPEPHSTPGIGRCDRSRFDGTVDQLRKAWPFSKEKTKSASRSIAKRSRRS